MDELWQRYRSFWTPVLVGLGVFLIGLIVVHVITDDPDAKRSRVSKEASKVKGMKVPARRKLSALKENRDLLETRVNDWATRLDQARGGDPVEAVVSDALKAAVLRGQDPEILAAAVANPASEQGRRILAVFEGDEVVAGRALAKYTERRQELLNNLRTGDLNVGFGSLLADVWSEFRARANRADVELRVEVLGFAGVASVGRSGLVQRLLNLARLAEILDLAIRSGVTTVVDIRLDQKVNPLGDDVFLREWPFSFTVQGDMNAIRPLLSYLTDPEHPVPLGQLELSQPPRSAPEDGRVQLAAKASSIIVRPAASLSLDLEEAR